MWWVRIYLWAHLLLHAGPFVWFEKGLAKDQELDNSSPWSGPELDKLYAHGLRYDIDLMLVAWCHLVATNGNIGQIQFLGKCQPAQIYSDPVYLPIFSIIIQIFIGLAPILVYLLLSKNHFFVKKEKKIFIFHNPNSKWFLVKTIKFSV